MTDNDVVKKGKIRHDGWTTTRCDSCHRVGEE